MGFVSLALYGKTHCKANHTNVLVGVYFLSFFSIFSFSL